MVTLSKIQKTERIYTETVANTQINAVIANSLQATFSGIKVRTTNELILFETKSYATVISIRAAYKGNGEKWSLL